MSTATVILVMAVAVVSWRLAHHANRREREETPEYHVKVARYAATPKSRPEFFDLPPTMDRIAVEAWLEEAS